MTCLRLPASWPLVPLYGAGGGTKPAPRSPAESYLVLLARDEGCFSVSGIGKRSLRRE